MTESFIGDPKPYVDGTENSSVRTKAPPRRTISPPVWYLPLGLGVEESEYCNPSTDSNRLNVIYFYGTTYYRIVL